MDWAALEIGQLLLYIMALVVPTAWITAWLYRVWRKANMPAILGLLNRQRRRDRTIKETRERTTELEAGLADTEERCFKLETSLRTYEERLTKNETVVAQLRHKLRSRGVVTDA